MAIYDMTWRRYRTESSAKCNLGDVPSRSLPIIRSLVSFSISRRFVAVGLYDRLFDLLNRHFEGKQHGVDL